MITYLLLINFAVLTSKLNLNTVYMTKFVLLNGKNTTIVVNPETVTFIEKWLNNTCCVHFIGGEKVEINEDYQEVRDKLSK